MILGIGIDLVEVPRIKKVVKKYPVRFVKRILGDTELSSYEKILSSDVKAQERAARFLAKRFATKEAVAKVLKERSLHGTYKFLMIILASHT